MLLALKLMATIEPVFPLRALTIPFKLQRLRATSLFTRKLETSNLPPLLNESVGVDPARLPGPVWCAAIPLDPLEGPLELHDDWDELHELHEDELERDLLEKWWSFELQEDCLELHESRDLRDDLQAERDL